MNREQKHDYKGIFIREMHMADEIKFFKYEKRENLILCLQIPDCTSLQPSLKKYIVKMMLMMNYASLQ